MITLQITQGREAGASRPVVSSPFLIGRDSACQLVLEEPGVWEKHARLSISPANGILLESIEPAQTRVNGELIQQRKLRNGDTIEIGFAKLQVWLSRIQQRNLRWREASLWMLLLLMALGQVGLAIKLSELF